MCNEDFSHSLVFFFFFLWYCRERGVDLQTLLEFGLKNKVGITRSFLGASYNFKGLMYLPCSESLTLFLLSFQLAIGGAKN